MALIKRPMHGREIAKALKQPLTTVQRTLKELEQQGMLSCATVGKNKIFSLKDTLQARQEAFMAEHYGLQKTLSLYPLLQPVLDDVRKEFRGMIVLFGSYAKGLAMKESDIDLYLQTTDIKIKKHIEQLHSLLSVKIGALSVHDPLTREIVQNHIIIQGVEGFYEEFPWKTQA